MVLIVVLVACCVAVAMVIYFVRANSETEGGPSPEIPSVTPYVAPTSAEIAAHHQVTLEAQREAYALFAAEMDERAGQVEGRWFSECAVGLKYPNADGSDRRELARTLKASEQLRLVGEPECIYDRNAVRVETMGGRQVGYLPRDTAARVVRSLHRGEAWLCFCRHPEGSHISAILEIALLHYNEAHLALPAPEKDFERWINGTAAEVKGWWRPLHLVGLHKENEDGVARRDVLRALEYREELEFVVAQESGKEPKVLLLDGRDQVVGSLRKQEGHQYIRELKDGWIWRAFFRDVCGEDYETPRARIVSLRYRPTIQ